MSGHRVLNALIEDLLSDSEGGYIICDRGQKGFPIAYVSDGFLKLFGLEADDCLDRKCGDVVGPPSIYAHDPFFCNLAFDHGLTLRTVEKGLKMLTKYAGMECKKTSIEPDRTPGDIGLCLQVNRRSGTGQLFVCEVVMFYTRHPVNHWPYMVGLQRDITKQLSVHRLLSVANYGGAFEELLASRVVHLHQHLVNRRQPDIDNLEYLHAKAALVYEDCLNRKQSPACSSSQLPATNGLEDSSDEGQEFVPTTRARLPGPSSMRVASKRRSKAEATADGDRGRASAKARSTSGSPWRRTSSWDTDGFSRQATCDSDNSFYSVD